MKKLLLLLLLASIPAYANNSTSWCDTATNCLWINQGSAATPATITAPAGTYTLPLYKGQVTSTTAPTIASGFCATSPSIPANNGTAAFTINVGTSCSGSTGTLTMPSATTGWACSFADVTTPASYVISQTGGSQTTVTLTSYSRTTGSASNFTASDVIRAQCVEY